MESSSQCLGLVLVLILGLLLFGTGTKSPEKRDQQAKLLHPLPVIGLRQELLATLRATLRSVTKTGDWAAEGYAKFTKTNSPYLILTLDRGLIVMLPPDQMKTVYRLSEERLDVFGTLQDQIQARWTVRDDRIIRDPFHRHLLPGQLTRDLDRHTELMVTEMREGFEKSWASATGWIDVNIWQSCFMIIARTVNSAFCGTPLCRNEDYLRALESQALAFFGGVTLIGIAPGPLKPFIGFLVRQWCNYHSWSISRICSPIIDERIKATLEAGPDSKSKTGGLKDGLQMIIEESISRDDPSLLSPQLIADRLTITNNVTVQGVVFTLQHMLLCLAHSDPEQGYVKALRDECRSVYEAAGQKWSPGALRKLRLMDSTLRESMRFVPFSTVALARTVVDQGGISIPSQSSNVQVPMGTTLAIPVECVHHDESIYEDAHTFRPFRFVSREDSEDGHMDLKTIKLTTSPDDHFFSFGTVKNPCPGRFLAVHVIKLFMAHALLNYEWEHMEGKLELSSVLAMKVPNQKATLRIRSLAAPVSS